MYKKDLRKNTFTDSVFESNIDKDKVSYFSKTISDVHGQRKRTVSHLNEANSKVNIEAELKKQVLKSKWKGDLHYYPDLKRKIDDNFGLNALDNDEECLKTEDVNRFYESLNANKDQCLIKYYIQE